MAAGLKSMPVTWQPTVAARNHAVRSGQRGPVPFCQDEGHRQVVMLAFGEKKARAVADMVEGPLTAYVPASMLQMHPKATIFLDEEAAMELKRSEYYKWVFDNKPDWQKI